MNIGIIGNGFVGSAMSCGLRDAHKIFVYDINPDRSSHTLQDTVNTCDVIFICVPTPSRSDGSIDLSVIENTIKSISHIRTDKLISIKSTVIPGTCDAMADAYNVRIVSNPEFLTERIAQQDFMNPRAVIIGGATKDCSIVEDVYREVYEPLQTSEVGGINHVQYIITGAKEAEMIKYVTNCFFASKVALMNQFYSMCEVAGIDYNEVISGVMADGRIFPMHIDVPGHDGKRGFGGHCFPKDINALISFAKTIGADTQLLEAVWKYNKEIRSDETSTDDT